MVNVTRSGEIVDIVCDDALEFVSVLDPMTGPFLQPPGVPVYLFRGVSSLAHELLPAAYRPDKYLFNDGSRWVHPPMSKVVIQCGAELYTLRLFFDIAASHGIRLPEDSQLLRRSFDRWEQVILGVVSDPEMQWPPAEFLSLIALAQHYGVATRALDWTWDPLVAAYFAARDIPKSENDLLVVWVFEYYSKYIDNILEPQLPKERPIIFFAAPGADNENLRAQRGMFMLQVHKTKEFDDVFIPQSYAVLAPQTLGITGVPYLKRVMVSSAEAVDVLTHVALSGFTSARLFPGLWGVAQEFEERRRIAESRTPIRKTAFCAELQAQIKNAEKLN